MKVLICFVFLLVSVALNEAASHSRLVRSPEFSGSSASASASAQSQSGGRGGGSGSIASANAESASFNNAGRGAYRPAAGRPDIYAPLVLAAPPPRT